jgi:putative molybdopterin biosynthesis protein
MAMKAGVPQVCCRVMQYRDAKAMTQAALARACGLTRQAISAIEAGTYFPNSIAALRIARALGCKVEDLFVLSGEEPVSRVHIIERPNEKVDRIRVAKVGARLVGYPLTAGRNLAEGFAPADGMLSGPPGRSQARILSSKDQLERTALLVGCDPGLGILSAHIERRNRNVRLLWLSASSQAALNAVRKGEAHMAGTHLPDLGDPERCVKLARRAVGKRGGRVVSFARWEQGLMVAAGNPKHIRSCADLARRDVRLINREPGSGSRDLLDEWLRRERVAPRKVSGYERITHGHFSVAHAVRFGGADVGVGLHAAAHACGLDFIPLADVRFDFVIPRDFLDHPAVAVLLELLQSRALREEIGALPGYDVSCMGATVADLPESR